MTPDTIRAMRTIIRTRELITQPTSWTPDSSRALIDALLNVADTTDAARDAAENIIRVVRRIYGETVWPFNGIWTHAEALHILDITIEDMRGAP